MLNLSECKQLLGPTAENLSDEDILKIRDILREFAEIALDTFALDIEHSSVPRFPPVDKI